MNARNVRKSLANARVYLFARRVYFETETAKLDAAINAKPKELGYGG